MPMGTLSSRGNMSHSLNSLKYPSLGDNPASSPYMEPPYHEFRTIGSLEP